MQAMRDQFLGKKVILSFFGASSVATVLDINEAGVTFCMHDWPNKDIQFVAFAANLNMRIKHEQ
jgi:hypothetical protein